MSKAVKKAKLKVNHAENGLIASWKKLQKEVS